MFSQDWEDYVHWSSWHVATDTCIFRKCVCLCVKLKHTHARKEVTVIKSQKNHQTEDQIPKDNKDLNDPLQNIK